MLPCVDAQAFEDFPALYCGFAHDGETRTVDHLQRLTFACYSGESWQAFTQHGSTNIHVVLLVKGKMPSLHTDIDSCRCYTTQLSVLQYMCWHTNGGISMYDGVGQGTMG